MSPENSQPPGGESQGLDDCAATDTHSVTRSADTTCPRCSRVLTSQRSLRLGYGRECWTVIRHSAIETAA